MYNYCEKNLKIPTIFNNSNFFSVIAMLNAIFNLFRRINPEMIVQAPARINLINPLDAVEGDFWMPSVAINGIDNMLSVFLYIKKTEDYCKLLFYKIKNENNFYEILIEYEEQLNKKFEHFKEKFIGENKIIYATLYRFYRTISLFRERFNGSNIEIGIITTIPKQSGLGGSAAIIIALIYGLANYFKIYNNLSGLKEKDFPINKDIIAEMATKVEDQDLKITAGYSDRYVICRGGLCFCSYYGKLHHRELSKEPLAICDRIDKIYNIKNLPIIVCYSGVSHHSGNVHDRLRKLYFNGNAKIVKNYKKLAEISWKSRFALMKHNWQLLGTYFNENTKIMNEIMIDAGFEHGIGPANNILIKIIEDHPDVYAAKLTGAGGGGSVFALVNPNKIEYVLNDWKNNLNEIIENENVFNKKFYNYPLEIRTKLKDAKFFKVEINQKGVSLIKNKYLIRKI